MQSRLYLCRLRLLTVDRQARDRRELVIDKAPAPSLHALRILIRPSALTFLESLIRNVLYLYDIVALAPPTLLTAVGCF